MLKQIVLLSALVGCCLGLAEFQGRKVCAGPDDCNPGECCVIPPYKDYPPRCQALRVKGQSCIPEPKTENGKATYVGTLDNQSHTVSYTNTYKYLCPCGDSASKERLVCRRLSEENTGSGWPVGNIGDVGNCWTPA